MTATDALDNPSYFALAASSPDGGGRSSPDLPPAPPPPPGDASADAPAVPPPPAAPAKPLLPLLKRRTRASGGGGPGPRAVSQGCPSTGTTRRLGFRWLLRSVSASSTSLQQIALGQPRPGDVAPPSPTTDSLSALDTPGPLASPGPVVSPGRLREQRSERSKASTPTRPVTATPCYYNEDQGDQATSVLRRHSVGSSCGLGAQSARAMPDDIVLIWSGGGGGSAASMWITYLQSCFVEICRKRGRPSFRTSDVSVDELAADGPGADRWLWRLEQAKLVVLVVCPAMLGRVNAQASALAGPMARLDSDRALLMLLGVHEYELQQLQSEHRAVLGGDCRRMAVRDQDASFVGEFLAVAMDILVRAWRARARAQGVRERRDGGPSGPAGALFSLSPKKVKQGMSKVLALLLSPLQPGDHVTVSVLKDNQPLTVSSRTRNPYTVQFAVPESMLDVSAMITVTVSVNGQPLGSRQLKCESRLRELDRILRAKDNPLQFLCQTLGFGPDDREALDNSLVSSYLHNVPPHFNLLQNHHGSRPSGPAYSCEQYPTLLHFAAQLGLERLAMALLDSPGGEQACCVRNCDDLTPAEMGERAGHSRLACALQGYMQMSELSSIYSMLRTADSHSGQSHPCGGSGNYLSPRPASETYSVPPPPAPLQPPSSLAPGLSPTPAAPPSTPVPDTGRGGSPSPPPADRYVAMNGGTRGTRGTRGTGELTSLTRDVRAQSGPPPSSPRSPMTSARRHSAPGEGTEAAASSTTTTDADLYLNVAHPEESPVVETEVADDEAAMPDYEPEPNSGWYSECESVYAESSTGLHGRRGSDPGAMGQSIDDDLMAVIRDLKSSSFSLCEVEHLVQAWRSRGRNSRKQSFREKQEELARMHEELNRVGVGLGGGGGGGPPLPARPHSPSPSPFERFRRVFSKARHGKVKEKGLQPGRRMTTEPPITGRPQSSLSRRSSSSSTWSGRSNEDVVAGIAGVEVEIGPLSWTHPVSPASSESKDEHYVRPLAGIRPVVGALGRSAPSLNVVLAQDGFPVDSSGFSCYVNVPLPSQPPPIPARPSAPSAAPSRSLR